MKKDSNGSPAKAREFFANKMAFTTGPVELSHRIEEGDKDIAIIDVRDAADYKKGHIPTAVNLPQTNWQTLAGLRKDKLNVLYCYTVVCHLAAKAAVEFAGRGFRVMEMDGGFKAWKENELPVEK